MVDGEEWEVSVPLDGKNSGGRGLEKRELPFELFTTAAAAALSILSMFAEVKPGLLCYKEMQNIYLKSNAPANAQTYFSLNALKSEVFIELNGGTKWEGIENSRSNGFRSKKDTPLWLDR